MSQAELTIDGYELINCIATGNVSQVWEVKQVASGQTFAMKLLLPEALTDNEQKRIMKHEASVARQLEHPNIIHFVDSKVSRKQAYIIMELFRSLNLKSVIRSDLNSVHVRLKKLMECCTQALAYMHEKNWLHKDIKPDNILLNKGGEVRVIDFSLASRPSSSVGRMVTRKNKIAIQGTRTYIAPEQIRREKITTAADIYSLGILFFEALTGRPPFMGTNPNELLMAHVRNRADVPSSYHPNISSAADDLVIRMLGKKPADRPESMQQVFSEVRSIQLFKQDPETYHQERLAAEAAAHDLTLDQRLNSRADDARTQVHGYQPMKSQPSKTVSAVEQPADPVAPQQAVPQPAVPQPAMPPAAVPVPMQQPPMPQPPMYQPAMQPMPMQPMMPPPMAPQPVGPPPMVGAAFPPGQYLPPQPGMSPGQPSPATQQPAQPSQPQAPPPPATPVSPPAQAPDAGPQQETPAQKEKDLETPDNLDWLSVS